MSHGGHADEGDINPVKIRATRMRIIQVAGDNAVALRLYGSLGFADPYD